MGQQYSEMKCQSATTIFGLGAESIRVGLALFYQRPSRLSPLIVAAVSAAAAAAAADDDYGGGGDDDDDDDNDNDDNLTTMMMLFWDLHTCSTRSPVNGKTTHVDDKPCPPRYQSRRH